MVILLVGVWTISAVAGVEQVWSDEGEVTEEGDEVGEEGLGLDPSAESEAEQPPSPATVTYGLIGEARRPTAVPMDRQAHSDGAVVPILPSGYETLSPSGSSCGMRRGGSNRSIVRSFTEYFPPSAGAGFSRRRSTTVVGGSRLSVSSSGGSGGAQVIPPGGLTIGLSPMSPGFGVARKASGGETGGNSKWKWLVSRRANQGGTDQGT